MLPVLARFVARGVVVKVVIVVVMKKG